MPPSGFRTRHDPLSRRRAALSWAVESCKPIGSGRKQPDQKQGSLRDDLININGIAQDLIRYRYTIPQDLIAKSICCMVATTIGFYGLANPTGLRRSTRTLRGLASRRPTGLLGLRRGRRHLRHGRRAVRLGAHEHIFRGA
jgi:hypothetical protein